MWQRFVTLAMKVVIIVLSYKRKYDDEIKIFSSILCATLFHYEVLKYCETKISPLQEPPYFDIDFGKAKLSLEGA